jgi:putative flippase GtrA
MTHPLLHPCFRFREMTFCRQLTSYAIVGLAASFAHYSVLIGLKEGMDLPAVPATLVGYVVGGFVSYGLNRRHTFASARPHREATWRFATVAMIGFFLTYALMSLFVDGLKVHYLPSQVVTTILAMFVTYFANKLWTFASS